MPSNESTERFQTKLLVSKLIRVNRLHRSVVFSQNSDSQLQRSGHMMLLYIANSPLPPSQKDVATAFKITPAAVAMSLKKMEQSGFIVRTPSHTDSRINLITVSEKGRDYLEKTRQRFEQADEQMLRNIPYAELDALSSTLDKLTENLLSAGAKDDLTPPFPKACKK